MSPVNSWIMRIIRPKPYDVGIIPYAERHMTFNMPTGKIQLPNFQDYIIMEEKDISMEKVIFGFTHEIVHKVIIEEEGIKATLEWDNVDKGIFGDYRISNI